MSSKRPFRGALIAGILLICFYLILYALTGNGNKITYENEKILKMVQVLRIPVKAIMKT
jgi:hypothetical protein